MIIFVIIIYKKFANYIFFFLFQFYLLYALYYLDYSKYQKVSFFYKKNTSLIQLPSPSISIYNQPRANIRSFSIIHFIILSPLYIGFHRNIYFKTKRVQFLTYRKAKSPNPDLAFYYYKYILATATRTYLFIL